MTRTRFVLLVVMAALEITTLAVLLLNLAVIHVELIARIVGPVHGAIYLVVALLTLLAPNLPWRARLLGLVPVVGGVLAVRRQARNGRSSTLRNVPDRPFGA